MKRSLGILYLFVSLASAASAAGVKVDFNVFDTSVGPFPNDFLTVPDARQKTGLRVNLPLPGCILNASDCLEIGAVNQLDGFSLRPRITVKFSGPINPDTIRKGVRIISMSPAYPRRHTFGDAGLETPVNQIQYDRATHTAYMYPDNILEQGRRHAVIVTNEVKDLAGDPVEIDLGFDLCLRRQIGGAYCEAMSEAAALLRGASVRGGSVFTTMAATSWLESAARVAATAAGPIQRVDSTNATGNVIDASTITAMRWNRQVLAGAPLAPESFPLTPGMLTQAGIGRIAFASVRVPLFQSAQNVIPNAPTGDAAQLPAETETIHFHVFLPTAPAPAGGYPVLLAGHGLGDSRFGMPTLAALNAASRGVAVVAMSAYGHGFGAGSEIEFISGNTSRRFPAPGRGRPSSATSPMAPFEGCIVYTPTAPYGIRDCLRQTALDYVALVSALRRGSDLDGDGRSDLNMAAVSYLGQSLGAFYGTLLSAVDPSIRSSVLNAGGGSTTETARDSDSFRPLLRLYLGLRLPPVLNNGLDFEDNYPERYTAAQLLSPGAARVGEVLDRLLWLEMNGAPVAFAPLLKSVTPEGSPIKRVLFQIALGDRTVPNPSNSWLIRAANMRETTSLYRHDRARAIPGLKQNPHSFLTDFDTLPQTAVSNAAFAQALLFLAGTDDTVPNVNAPLRLLFGQDIFEVPRFLPDGVNFTR